MTTKCKHKELEILNATFCVKCGKVFKTETITQDLLDRKLNK